ncbi:hypothetical protein UFOVP634_28 [uncultured Caudovirales phage]|uniref:Uncharacterized protein n=1 Tax=uncultured Caudovirales phage TaxID=2100421 RepID=A0A6J5N4T4_9CAUD|nr:hypothetical protein UFOVP634_28 [uncultured Caudovirales phage]
MAITGTTVDIRGKAVEPILEEVLFANKTIADGYVTFNSDIKAGTIFTEAGVDVTAQLYTGAALSSSGSININERIITPTKLEYKQTFLQESLRAARFNRTMAPGAFNIESDEFASTVLAMVGPNVSQDAESIFWGGITSATKTAIAALTPGSAQGSMTAATQTAVAALTAGQVDGVFAKVLYDQAALGSYIKVTGTTVTAANIASQFALIYAAIPAELLADTVSPVVVYAPRAWKQLARIANNAVGAAQQINFLFESAANDSKCYYNGVEILFVPTPNNLMAYAQRKAAVSWNTDLLDDVNRFEVGKLVNDGDTQFVRSIYTLAANVGQANKGVLYGG